MVRFWRSEAGNFGIMTAVLLPALLAGVGVAVDTANIINAKSRLQNIVDGAVLAASRENASDAERERLFDDFVSSQIAGSTISSTVTDLTTREGLNYVEVTGRVDAKVSLFLMNRFGSDSVTVSATSFRSTKTLEIAMVLDNTGSMGQAGINALKKASKALLDAVESEGDPRQDVRIGLVPFVTAVNIKGEGFDESWIDKHGASIYNGWNFITDPMRTARQTQNSIERRADLTDAQRDAVVANWSHFKTGCSINGNSQDAQDMRAMCARVKKYPHHMHLFEQAEIEWKGCVEARPIPYNFDLTPPDPARPDTLFVPYFAPSEPRARMTSGGNDGSNFNNAWLDHKTSHDQSKTADQHLIQRSPIKYMYKDTRLEVRPTKSVQENPNLTLGPNRACPTPIVPLTKDMAKVRAGIDAMQFWNGSGTNISEGLAWGWRVLSPEAPYTQAAPFGSDSVSKFMVLMTDGTNVSFGASNTINKSDYGSYGFLGTKGANNAASRIDGKTSQGEAEKVLNTWTGNMCAQMKSQGVEVFTVLYNVTNAAVKTLFETCASRKENFHMASNTTALEKAFSDIGRSVAALHLTH
ncbi:pilus assembly protein TadG-related protein [Mesorhizobium sp. YIM 152430]|uniref:pilus assembly protein TadG-related protein n=1 Tax=Mesorhizobium sp. YIM 152430 TaxID=3031761 RepID=UPI0023DBDE45|nr:pilus assembly protein TadG-related protein [Mesorhizobium sp. YIM 152430]MDF1599835.1 pilus assembly protein TadG-related protein [Mesorhizobium sp. YIM 152430]